MTKRQKLNYNSDELAHHLAQSKGQGVDALFSPPSPTLPTTLTEGQEPAKEDESTQTPRRARTHAPQQVEATGHGEESTLERTNVSMHARIVKDLKRGFLDRRHLSSFTFRFKAKELEDLDKVTVELNKESSQKISKNDIVRLALNWLLEDYEKNKGRSMLTNVVRNV